MYGFYQNKPVWPWRHTIKILLMIKLTTIILFITMLQVSAATLAQKVTLHVTNVPLERVFDSIRDQSGVDFFFSASLIGKAKPVSVHVKDLELNVVLAEIFRDQPLSYVIKNNSVQVRAKEYNKIVKPGRVSGKIVDEKGEALPGASIRVLETGAGTVAAVDGTYILNLPPGSYTLEFSYLSFQTQRVTGVMVIEGKSTPLHIALQPDAKGLKEVAVTSGYKKASTAGLYARQRNTSNLSDGISAEQIGATPDKHVGESLKRITGVSTNDNRKVVIRGIAERYNVSLLNGSSLPSTDVQERDFEFNLIPTNLVDNIVVAKSITADMPYGFAGGLVQITTKSVPESNFFSISAGSSYNSRTMGKDFLGYGRGKYDYLGFDDGGRDHFPDNMLNLVGKFDPTKEDSQNEIKAAQVAEQNKRIGGTERLGARRFQAMPSQNYQLSLGRTYSLDSTKVRQLGFVGSVSYRNTQTNDYVSSMRRGDWAQVPTRGDDPTDVNTGNIYKFNTTLGLLLNGGFKTEKHQINTYNLYTRIFDNQFSRYTGWTFERPKNDDDTRYPSILEDERPKFTDLLQNKVSGTHRINSFTIEWGVARTSLKSVERDAISAALYPRETGNRILYMYSTGTISDPGAGPLHRDEYFYKENNVDAVISAAYDFTLGKTRHTLKTGANYLKKHAFYDWQVLPIAMGPNSTVPIELIPIQEWGNYMSMEDTANSLFYFKQDYNSNKFEAKSLNKGAFVMLDHKLLPGLRLVWGARAEYFKLDTVVNSASTLADKNSKIFFAEKKDWYFLPSANATYSPIKDLNLRASYARAAVRPGMMENSRFSRFNPNYGSVVRSNGVSSTLIDNYDAKVELFPGAGEILSVAYFYKYFDKPAEYYRLDNENNGRGYITISNSDWANHF
jgi:outer membrane receptor protein involved in Fe transport